MACEGLAVSASDAAKLLGISPAHFFNLKRSGRLGPKGMRLGRAVRYGCAELEAWIRAGTPGREKWDAISRMGGLSESRNNGGK